MKMCRHCLVEKEDTMFGACPRNNDGLKSWCKQCCIDYRRQWAKDHKDRIKEFRKEDYQKHSERYKSSARQWSKDNPEWKHKTDKEWRENNAARKAETDREYRKSLAGQANRFVSHMKRRKAKENGSGISQADARLIYSEPCVYCGSRDSIQIDHIVPLAMGGINDISNVAPACKKCNRSKGTKSLLVFMYERIAY